MARRTIESMSAKPKVSAFGNHLILDLNEFRDKGFSAANVNWSVEDWTVIVTFRDEGLPPNGIHILAKEEES